MNNELENTANEALRVIIDNAAAAKDFILAELPEVVQQLLMWKMVESMVECAVYTIVVLAVCLTIRWQWVNRAAHVKLVVVQGTDGGCYLFNLVLAVPLFLGPGQWNMVWLQIWIAPKVYLLEYAAALVK